jgi:hypothetical protein
MKSSTNTSLLLSTESTTTRGQFQLSDDVPNVRRRQTRANKNVENAIYTYMRAVRALGRTKIDTGDVANALSLPLDQVNGALSSLKKKGVKTLNG